MTDPQRRIVTEVFPFDGGRRVSASVPSSAPRAVVYAGDGQLVVPWGASLESTAAPPTLVVGIDRSGDPDETARLREYSPGFAPEVFAAHERFLLADVRDWVADRFGIRPGPERTAVHGVSAGAEFALAEGIRHPEVFGSVLAASPGGGYRPPSPMPTLLPRVHLLAGDAEPFFRENADRWEDALRGAGGTVVGEVRRGGHGDPFWADAFPSMVTWAFAR